MAITIKSKVFGELKIPKDGSDTQENFEAFMDDFRARTPEFTIKEGEKFMPEKHSRILVELAIKHGFLEAVDYKKFSPKHVLWIADGIGKYITDTYTVDPN